MRIIKKINSSAVMCVDGDGRQLVALGRGVGFCEIGSSLEIERIERTFYDVDPRYLAVLSSLPPEVVEFASQFADVASGMFSYELSPNLSFILADHIAFAIKRAKEKIEVKMPLAFDVAHQYPLEYRLGSLIVSRINSTFHVSLPADEAAGMVMVFINNIVSPGTSTSAESDRCFSRFLDRATSLIERIVRIEIDRSSFNYARYATHLQYLYRRAKTGETIQSDNSPMYASLIGSYPQEQRCIEGIDRLIEEEVGHRLSDEEKLYLLLHINRVLSVSHADS